MFPKKSLQAPNIRYFKIRVDRLFVSLVSTGYERYKQTACFKKWYFDLKCLTWFELLWQVLSNFYLNDWSDKQTNKGKKTDLIYTKLMIVQFTQIEKKQRQKNWPGLHEVDDCPVHSNKQTNKQNKQRQKKLTWFARSCRLSSSHKNRQTKNKQRQKKNWPGLHEVEDCRAHT